MPKRTNEPRSAQAPQDTQKMYAHAYGVRLAKQVAEQVEDPRRKATEIKKRDAKR